MSKSDCRRCRIQIVVDQLCAKRLDAGRYTWPVAGAVDPVTAAQLWALVAGLEVSGWKKHWHR